MLVACLSIKSVSEKTLRADTSSASARASNARACCSVSEARTGRSSTWRAPSSAVCGASRAEKKAETRQRLLDAAGRVFARRSFHGASVDEIAEEAGFSKGAVYSNFASKEDLFLALLERRIDERIKEIARVVESDAPSNNS
jgi:hypothetical protein